jgi:Cdc6-like AAA superfamily ATPase
VEADEVRKLTMCRTVFNESAPINRFQLFKGRRDQLTQVISAVGTRGKHVVLYGDRGVGKTSLATILKDALSGVRDAHSGIGAFEVAKANCNDKDTYLDVWRRALSEIIIVSEKPEDTPGNKPVEYALSGYVDQFTAVGSGELKRILNVRYNDTQSLVIIFDEVDRLSKEARRLFADTIKDFSDSSTNVTVMLVGVATDLTSLIEEHKSIERCIAQIYMPPMNKKELRDIIDGGMRMLGMSIEPEARDIIVSLSRGYPYYTHLLAYEATCKAIKSRSPRVHRGDVASAIRVAISGALETVRDDYLKAAEGQRKGTSYPLVLLSCALATPDDVGYFKPTDLKVPTSSEVAVRASKFSEQLNKLATDDSRGPALERWGTARRYKFRFRNPLLRPYIIMKGINDGLVGGLLLEGLTGDGAAPKKTLFDDFI